MLVRFVLAVALLFLFAVSPAAALDKGGKSEAERLPADMAQAERLRADMAQAERLRADMEGQVERLKLNVEKFMEVQDKRIGDLSVYANMNNGLIAFLALGITLAVAVIGFRFPKMAVLEAKKTVDEWVGKEGKQHLDSRFEHFQKEMTEKFAADLKRALDDFRTEVAPHLEKVQEGCALIDTMREKVSGRDLSRTSNAPAGSVSDIASDPEKLRAAAAEAMAIPDEERSFDDWYLLAWASWDEGEEAAAFNRFAKARAVGTTDRLLAFKASYNGARAAHQLERWQDAVALCDDALEQWRQGGLHDVDFLVLDTFLQKCASLFALERPQEMLDTANEALAATWDSSDADVLITLELIDFKRAIALQSLGRDEEAEEYYDGFIHRYDQTDDSYLRGELASALYNKMLLRRKMKDKFSERRLLEDIEARFGKSTDDDHIALVVAEARKARKALDAETASAAS